MGDAAPNTVGNAMKRIILTCCLLAGLLALWHYVPSSGPLAQVTPAQAGPGPVWAVGVIPAQYSEGGFLPGQMYPGTDFYGSDFQVYWGIGSAATCQTLCYDNPRCVAFTWVRPGYLRAEPACCLKQAVPPPTPNDCCISGIR